MAERMVLCGRSRRATCRSTIPTRCGCGCGAPQRNIRLHVEDVRRALWGNVPPIFCDLLDLAVYVFVADQAVRRGGDADQDLGAAWRRRLFFRVPVRCLEVWTDPAVQRQLVAVLSFLSEDEYHFEFERLRAEPSLQGYFEFQDGEVGGAAEEVLLFSGGLDSLAGAVQEAVVDRRRVLLVHHRSASKRRPRHERLLHELRRHARDAPPWHVPVWIDKAKVLSREFTQRTRSFLFAALGVALATAAGLSRLRFYENGVLAVNLPLAGQVVGARASRTTHPQALTGFARLLTLLRGGRSFAVDNPFLWSSKAEVVRLIAEAHCADLIEWTTSCTHPWARTRTQTHCGLCSQCIDRRFGVLAAGQEAHDPAEAYAVDLVRGGRNEGIDRAMLAVYLETANQVAKLGLTGFFARYGESTRVLEHTGETAEAAALKLFQLYQRHAGQVNAVVDQALAAHAPCMRRRELPEGCLIRLVINEGDAGTLAARPAVGAGTPRPDYLFRRKGQVWEVRFAGGSEFLLLPQKGAAYLSVLLSNPGVSFSAAELACLVAGQPRRYALGDAGEALDREALSAYEARYQELQEELDEARANNDEGTEIKCQRQMAALHDELRKARGLNQRRRRESDDRERVRKAVGIAIRRALKDIGKYDRRLAEHLSRPRLVCGSRLCYQPDKDFCWESA